MRLPVAARTALRFIGVCLACTSFALQAPAWARADPNKVLHVAFEAADDGFDMARTNSLYTNWMVEAIFEGMLTYDYLARPAKLIPETAEAMPETSADGLTYTFHIRKGIYFAPDAAFKGQRRELTASDYAYTIKRHFDPQVRSVQNGNFRGKIAGLDELGEKAKKSGRFDYDAPVAGLETPDRYTLRIRLNRPDYTFLYYIANSSTFAMAREVVEHYGSDVGRHPVGTGAYMVKEYVPRSKIVLEANPEYRGFTWDFKSSGEAWDEQVIHDMKGKQMPQVGRVEVNIIEEEQARWLAFDSRQLDFAELSPPASPNVLNGDKLKPQFAEKGIGLYRYAEPGSYYTFFNFRDPVVGGYTNEKIALRRAIAMAYNDEDEIRQVWFGQAVKAKSMVPPGIAGFNPKYRSSIDYDPELAGKLLDHFGYKKGPDGWRTTPDGKPLVVKIHGDQRTRDIAKMEIWKRSLDRINVHTSFPVSSFADNLKSAYRCELPVWGLGGTASIPDAIDFFQTYYGPNEFQGNFGCYKSKAFDETYEKALLLPDGPERNALYERMLRIMEADTAEVDEIWLIRNWLIHPWIKGFKKHPVLFGDWRYLDVDKH